ncbi:MAG: transposase, partial [Salinisphaera sp.]|nr:transposase [Salinisphaera sp.]
RPKYRRDGALTQAVALSDSVGRTEAARQLDIPVKSLANWVATAQAGRPLRSPKRKPVDDLESEVSRLQAENAILKMEREILKKATAFFARESK